MKATIFFQNTFGLNLSRNVRLHGIRSSKPFQSSFETKLALKYTLKGHRKPVATRFDGAVYIVLGWVEEKKVEINSETVFFGKQDEKPDNAALVFNEDLELEKCDDVFSGLEFFDIEKLNKVK